MKKIIFTILIAIIMISAVTVNAGSRGKGINVEVGLSRTDGNNIQGFIHPQSYTIISPQIGFRFNRRLTVGLTASISLDNKDDLLVGVNNHYGVFAEYNIWYKKGFYIFLTAEACHVYQKKNHVILDGFFPDYPHPPLPAIHSATEVGIAPGVGYKIPKIGIDVKLRYGFIGYNDMRNPWECYHSVRNYDGCVTRGDFMLDGSRQRLKLSVGYTFGW